MVKKAVLAKYIIAGKHSPNEWRTFMPRVKGLRVKDVGSRGEVQISMDDKGWFSPESWLANYQAEVRERLTEELKVAGAVLPTGQISELLLQHVDKKQLSWFTEQEYEEILSFATATEVTPGQRCVNALNYIGCRLYQDDLAMYFTELLRCHPYFKSNS
jgi:hypothetical protein